MLTLPRLADRKDKRALIRHIFAQEAAAAPKVSLSEDLIDALCTHQWPGNIRQLRNVLRAMIALRASDLLELADLPVRANRSRGAQSSLAARCAIGGCCPAIDGYRARR